MSDGEHAGVLLRTLRLQARMSPEEVAAGAETSVAYLLAVEEGSLPASRPFVRHVADVIAGKLLAAEPRARPSRPLRGGSSSEDRAEPA
ncbi:helix-turn-helix domain-containing protein [Arenivirga flava]|uniref:Uncharacterized protein n=1 Tax=Arenivirga flava TaxID=1930060 RepID=A0AA37UG53_9MICO|nr:helix-turn-helix domain-containing protein [Arenivirga flava]GMA28208.1 hypothetical protein GCM10025874_14610 [Arenivirga flava]